MWASLLRFDVNVDTRTWPWLRQHGVIRKILVSVLGGFLVIMGTLMLALPGPGILTLLFGLSVLAAEFAWARRSLDLARNRLSTTVQRYEGWKKRRGGGPSESP